MEVDKKALFPPVGPGHCQQLYPFIFIEVGRKSHTEIFNSPLSERCWHGLGISHDHPYLQGDQLQLLLKSEDWKHVTISTDLAAISRNCDTCIQRGVWHEWWCSNLSSVMWRFVRTKTVLWIITQRTTYTSFHPSSVPTFEALTTK